MRALAAACLLALACSGGKSLVLVEVSAGDPTISLTSVEVTATPASGSVVTRHFDWNSTAGPLEAGIYLPGSVEGHVDVRATGMDGTSAVEANGQATVEAGKVSERVALQLRRVFGGPPDGGAPMEGGAPMDSGPADGGAGDGSGMDVAPADTALPPDLALPPDMAPPPIEPPTLTRCTVYEHAAPCTLTPTTDGVGVWDVTFSPDGRYLLSGGDDGRVKIWQVTPTGLVDDNHAFSAGPNNTSAHHAFSADGTKLAVGGGDGTVVVYEFPKMTRLAMFTTNPGGIIFLAFSNDANRLVSIDNAMTAKLWDLTTKAEKTVTFANPLQSYALSPGGQPGSLWLATSENGSVGFALRDLAAEPVPVIPVDTGLEVFALAFSPDGQKLTAATADGKMTLWDVANKAAPVAGPALWPASGGPVGSTTVATEAVFSSDGRFVVASGSLAMFTEGYIRIATIQPPGLQGATTTVSSAMSIALSHDGKSIAAGSWRCGKITFCRD